MNKQQTRPEHSRNWNKKYVRKPVIFISVDDSRL